MGIEWRLLPAAVVLAGAACASTGGPAHEEARLLRLDAEWNDAAQRRDLERVLSFWSDDATVLPPGGPALVGRAAIREYVVKSLEVPGFSISWKTDRVVVSRSGDLAYGTGTNRVTFHDPEGGPVVIEGKAVTVWRKGPDGEWKCVIDIWNDAAPPAAGG